MRFPPRDPETLAARAAALLGDAGLRHRVAELGRRRVEGYSWDGVAARYADLYAAVCAGAFAGAR